MVLKQEPNLSLSNSAVTSSPRRVTAAEKEDEKKERWWSPLGKAAKKYLKDSALCKRVQRNSGMEGTSLPFIVRKEGGEKQKGKRVEGKGGRGKRKHRHCPKSPRKPTVSMELWSLQLKFYFQKTPSKCSLNACPAPKYPAGTRPCLFGAHTCLMGQPLFNKGIKLHYEEKRQLSGPRSEALSIESALFTVNTAERRKYQLAGFQTLFSSFPRLPYFQKTIELHHSDGCQHPKTDIGCPRHVNI